MITFIVVTTIINLAAGYALAVYLRAGEPMTFVAASPSVTAAQPTAPNPAAPADRSAGPLPASIMSTAAGMAPLPPAPAQAEAAPTLSSFHQESTVAEADTQRSGLDEDLLAGIEEFRNQLAQLKTKGDDAPVTVLGGV